MRGFLEAVKADFGCLFISVLFLILMASTIIFATVLTPNQHDPLL